VSPRSSTRTCARLTQRLCVTTSAFSSGCSASIGPSRSGGTRWSAMHKSEIAETARLFPVRLRPWLRFLRHRGDYQFLSEDELRATRRCDTVFVFGSGRSLNEL